MALTSVFRSCRPFFVGSLAMVFRMMQASRWSWSVGRGLRRLISALACCWIAAALAACDYTTREAAIVAPVDPPGGDPVQEPTDVKYYPSDEPVRMGLEQYNRGNYGISQRYFKDAVEKAPKDVTAWVGLAASYDKLRRFDLADQAYAQAIRLGGETVQILNDQGYSLMLRGNLNGARRKFEKAYSLDPGNPVIANNLELLNGSRRFIERPPNNQP
ncbi:tetratricopeptide repeat protein [Bradyrhizobium diazoefficiens]|uniref:tetratricopeptide repeat protein n=1 Tax=Bradyrhizobium diazoefficiens TaxID=1355477 RepID=UPI002729AE41|nr:tetratricopeptide repeat protein [Bradyrhizobium diazoefficiens]WLA68406.1 tetratricopeptide repeat protein [Bradyrhizobium diazoefficiens]